MLRQPPVSHPPIYPLHLADDTIPKHISDHVAPPFNRPLLFPQRLKDNVLPWKAFTTWPYPFLWPYTVSLFYSIIHSSQLQRKSCISLLHISHVIFLRTYTHFFLHVDAWPTPIYPPRLNISAASFRKPLLTIHPGWAHFLSPQVTLFFITGVNRAGRI